MEDETVIVDWEGTSKQVPGGINPSFPFTKSCAYAALSQSLMQISQTVRVFSANNGQSSLGSLLNPKFPALVEQGE